MAWSLTGDEVRHERHGVHGALGPPGVLLVLQVAGQHQGVDSTAQCQFQCRRTGSRATDPCGAVRTRPIQYPPEEDVDRELGEEAAHRKELGR